MVASHFQPPRRTCQCRADVACNCRDVEPRACPGCGQAEERRGDQVNLDPYTGRCLPCLQLWAKGKAKGMPSEPRDWQRVAANDGDD